MDDKITLVIGDGSLEKKMQLLTRAFESLLKEPMFDTCQEALLAFSLLMEGLLTDVHYLIEEHKRRM